MADYLQIVVSLPQQNGMLIKNTLKKIAEEKKRSLANLSLTILTEWLEANGYDCNPTSDNTAINQDTGEPDAIERSRVEDEPEAQASPEGPQGDEREADPFA